MGQEGTSPSGLVRGEDLSEKSPMNPSSRSDLNDRYSNLSRLFRSAWTFHQFVQGVNKVFSNDRVDLPTLSFQGVYGRLKAVPAALQSDDLPAAEAAYDEAVTDWERQRYFERI